MNWIALALASYAAASSDFSPRLIYRNAGPAVVLLICGEGGGRGELGTGSIIDERGRVLTNAHVVLKDSGRPYETIKVYLKPAKVTGDPQVDLTKPYQARVVKYDRDLDLALLQVQGLPKVTPLRFGDSESIEPGEQVAAIGHPEQGGLWTLTTGVVSTVLADLGGVKGKNVFQTDASINRGNSGGPLLNRDGAQIGVNTSMARKAADGLTITAVNFSVRAEVARRWIGDSAMIAQAPMAQPAENQPAATAAKAETQPVAVRPTPKPDAATAPVKAPVAEAVKPAMAEPVKPAIVTAPKPYKIDDLIAKEIGEMEDLEKQMRGEIERRR